MSVTEGALNLSLPKWENKPKVDKLYEQRDHLNVYIECNTENKAMLEARIQQQIAERDQLDKAIKRFEDDRDAELKEYSVKLGKGW